MSQFCFNALDPFNCYGVTSLVVVDVARKPLTTDVFVTVVNLVVGSFLSTSNLDGAAFLNKFCGCGGNAGCNHFR